MKTRIIRKSENVNASAFAKLVNAAKEYAAAKELAFSSPEGAQFCLLSGLENLDQGAEACDYAESKSGVWAPFAVVGKIGGELCLTIQWNPAC